MLQNKVVLITGISRGVGAALAKALAEQGAIVVGTSRDPDTVARMNQERESASLPGFTMTTDLRDDQQIEQLFTAIDQRYGRIDVLINNAGIARQIPFLEMTREVWRAIIETNLDGLFRVTQQAVSRMVKQKSGHVLFIASDASVKGIKKMSAYCASKHGVLGFARTLQEELHQSGILISTLMPGPINTTILGGDPKTMNGIRPEDIAAAIVHLLSLPKSIEVREMLMQPTRLSQ